VVRKPYAKYALLSHREKNSQLCTTRTANTVKILRAYANKTASMLVFLVDKFVFTNSSSFHAAQRKPNTNPKQSIFYEIINILLRNAPPCPNIMQPVIIPFNNSHKYFPFPLLVSGDFVLYTLFYATTFYRKFGKFYNLKSA
jgi:hypothetical protein